MLPVTTLVINVSSVALIWFGGMRIDDGEMQVGSLIAFLSYFMQILMAVLMATIILVMLPRAVGVRRAHHRGAVHRRRRSASPEHPKRPDDAWRARSGSTARRSAIPAPIDRCCRRFR